MEVVPEYFFTGFPGFLATQIIHFLAKNDATSSFTMLVHPSQLQKAQQEAQSLRAAYRGAERFTVLPGDITQPNLGLSEATCKALQGKLHFVFHLAAIYDLAVPKDLAYQVNVIGTKRVLEWVETLPHLRRFVYFSTAYVSGTRRGRVLETELAEGQTFKNHYESTKYEAEVLVQARMNEVPTTVIRPGIVVGNSQTGETIKFDGPYFIMRFLDRFAHLPVPKFGSRNAYLNVVPVDFIVKATCHLAHAESGKGRVYHLTDPRPYPATEVHHMICVELLGKSPSYTLPTSLVATSLAFPPFRRWVQVEHETIAYFQCDTMYDATQATHDLTKLGIQCPDFKEYVRNITSYYKRYRHDDSKRIRVT